MMQANATNGYTDARMNLNEVCNWLTCYGHKELSQVLSDSFTYHTFTKDGYVRKDVIEQIITSAFGANGFKHLECDVTTCLNVVPLHEAHCD
jgi:hypothetical protein